MSSSRRPVWPSTAIPAAASSSVIEPSAPMAYRDTAPSAKLVVNAYRSSLLTIAQQISLRPFPTDRETAERPSSPTTYDEAAALPRAAPKASVTTSVPALVNANPYGVGPADGISRDSPRSPSESTG